VFPTCAADSVVLKALKLLGTFGRTYVILASSLLAMLCLW
jgi:hypothetical protein